MKTILFFSCLLVILCLVTNNWKTIKGIVTGWKLAERIAGYATVAAVSFVIDDVLWPVVMLWQGPILGGIIMFWIVLLVNLVMIWAYDRIKKDVLAFEAFHELTEQEQRGIGKKLLVKLIRVGRVPAFIAISFYDPFLSVIYMRKGMRKFKMEGSDWVYFCSAMVISCVGWTFCWQGVIITVKTLMGK